MDLQNPFGDDRTPKDPLIYPKNPGMFPVFQGTVWDGDWNAKNPMRNREVFGFLGCIDPIHLSHYPFM